MGVYLKWKDGFVNEIQNLSDEWFDKLKKSIKSYLNYRYIKVDEATRSEVIEKIYEFVEYSRVKNPFLKKQKDEDILKLPLLTLDPLLGSRIASDGRAALYFNRMISISKSIQSYPEHINLADHLDYYRLFITLSDDSLLQSTPINDFCFFIDEVDYPNYIERLQKGTLFPTTKTISKKEKIKPEYDINNRFSNISVTLLFMNIAYALIMNEKPKEEEVGNE